MAGLGALAGCSPKIGDKCTISTDCSIQGDRLCDPTQPGGYCTVFNCEPNRCPDDAVCVAFNEGSCSSPALSRRFQRTFCMLVCESDNDCRADYKCLDTSADPFRQVVDQNPPSRKICTVQAPASMPMSVPDSGSGPAVCQIPDSGPQPEAGADVTGSEEAAVEAATPDATEVDAAPESSTDDAPGTAD